MDAKYYFNNTYAQPQTPTEIKDESIDEFISQRSRILNSKLENFDTGDPGKAGNQKQKFRQLGS